MAETVLPEDFNQFYRRARLQHHLTIGYSEARERYEQLFASGETDADAIRRAFANDVPSERRQWRLEDGSGSFCQQQSDRLEASRQRHVIAGKLGFRPKPDCCEVCHRRDRIVLDHCHQTEKLRGWLCDACNHVLGMVADDAHRLDALAAYLRSNA